MAKDRLRHGSGCSLLEWQLSRLAPHFEEVLVLGKVSARDESYSSCRQLGDPAPFAGKGPLAGLLAGLRGCNSTWLALMPIDMPFFPPEVLPQALASALTSSNGLNFKMLGFLDEESRRQWLPGLYHRELAGGVVSSLRQEKLSLGSFAASVPNHFQPWNYARVDDKSAFLNLNTRHDAEGAGFYLPNDFA